MSTKPKTRAASQRSTFRNVFASVQKGCRDAQREFADLHAAHKARRSPEPTNDCRYINLPVMEIHVALR